MLLRRKEHARKRPTFFLFRILLLIFLIGLAAISWKIFSLWQERRWKEDGLTILVASENPTVYSYKPGATLIVIQIPKDTEVEAAGGYGRFLVGNLWEFGLQEKDEGILARSIQKNLGIPIDAWIDKKGEKLFESKFFEWLFVKTNLNLFDRAKIFLTINQVGLMNRHNIDLVRAGVLRPQVLSDGTKGFVVVPEKAITTFSILHDERVLEEGKTLRIVNTTKKDGLGKDTSYAVTTLGLRVIAIEATTDKYSGLCKVKVSSSHRNSYSARRLATLFGCEFLRESPKGQVSIEMVLGERFAQLY
jgi:hypothetical protein